MTRRMVRKLAEIDRLSEAELESMSAEDLAEIRQLMLQALKSQLSNILAKRDRLDTLKTKLQADTINHASTF